MAGRHLRRREQNSENHLCLAKILSGPNAFQISDIQEDELRPEARRDRKVTILRMVENPRMEFSVWTGGAIP